jgi:L-aminopeptidase/D-esterase-like protein/DNA helicase HerA-like ATPase
MPVVQDFEKLGLFYLGREYDLENRRRTEGTVLYDSRDLVTHAVCLGMTGSGKTGLCLCLLEEAAIDGVPAIAIDPKGDIANLLLTFPRLAPDEFRPWVAEDEARRKGLDPDAFAAAEAARWSKGLAEWGQDAARIERLRAAAEFSIYTPRSRAGRGLSILKSFAAPPSAVRDDADALAERIRAAATSLLSLVGLDADPLNSREHALISTLLGKAWRAGRDLTIEGIVGEVQRPPVSRIGALDLDSFFPEKDRFALAMRLNGLLAAPGFDAWLQGDPLDVGGLLFTAEGRPRVSIISTAHLSEAERMFITALVLSEVVTWVRAQRGTSSLRAILYMDEVFGYLPPVANPPSKGPLMTLLKQARAGGLGLVLATQNPVDLDYKALSNAGTWFLGRLQTERDKARVLDGLTSAAAGATFDRARADEVLSALTTRIFLMHNVHESEPVVFETRWAMSYLRGPLGRDEISRLSHGSPRISDVSHGSSRITPTQESYGSPRISAASRPVVPSQVRELFGSATTAAPHYEPALYTSARLEYRDAKRGVDVSKTINYLVPFVSGPDSVDFEAARETPLAPDGFANEPAPNATFGELPPDALKVKSYAAWKQQVLKRLMQRERLELFRSDAFDLVSDPGESERDFRARLQARARETRDELTEKLRQKYAGRTAALTERIRRAEQAVARESEQMKSAGWQTAVSLGATVLGALLGRKTVSASTVGRATTTARGGLRSMKEREDVQRAEENVQALKEQLAAIEAEAAAAIEAEGAAADPLGPLGRIALEPKPSKSGVEAIALAWIPMLLVLMIATTAGAQTKPRARDLGIPFDGTPGPLNAITDVGGVEVGLTTLTAGPARTGVTAILPRGKSSADPAFAGWFSLNGNGEMTGTTWIEEAGFLEGAVFITNTHSVGVVRDAAIAWSTKHGKLFQPWSLPVVAETYDGGLNDINGFHVKPEHVFAALDGARGGLVAEGNVGGGTGMRCYGFKCGTGTASRKVAADRGGYTIGVLVQANMGLRSQLLVAGVPVGKELDKRSAGLKPGATMTGDQEEGSIIIVVATDAPMLPHQLKRVARRASHGLARTGATSGNGSGDIFIAFSTANPGAASSKDAAQVAMVSNERISAVFEATVQATEEAIINALVAAETMTGADGRAVQAISHDRLREALRKYNRLPGK